MKSVGYLLLLLAAIMAIVGLSMLVADKFFPAGRLPGDIKIEKERFVFFFPVTTCIVISIILTVLINIILKLFHK